MWLLAFASAALAAGRAAPVSLDALGVEVTPLAGWTVEEGASTELEAHDPSGLDAEVFATDFQVALSPESAKDWAVMSANRLRRRGLEGVRVDRAEVVGDAAEIEIAWDGGLWVQRSVPSRGRTVHLAVEGPSPEGVRAAAAAWTAGLDVRGLPEDPGLTGRVLGSGTWSGQLPEGWRTPLPSEAAPVAAIAQRIGQTLDPDRCAVGIRPDAAGSTDLLLACGQDVEVGIVDVHSFAGEEEVVRGAIFGASAATQPAAVPLERADRTGFLWQVGSGGTTAFLALTPATGGAVLTTVVGPNREADDLRVSATAFASSLSWADGGVPSHGAAAWAAYTWRYRPTWTAALLSPFALLAGLGWWRWRRSRPSWEDLAAD